MSGEGRRARLDVRLADPKVAAVAPVPVWTLTGPSGSGGAEQISEQVAVTKHSLKTCQKTCVGHSW